MRLLTPVLGTCLLAIAILTFSGCTKEIIKETTVRDSIIVRRDSIIVRHDSIINKTDVPKIFPKKWFLQSHEIEYFSLAGVVTQKKAENFVSNGFYNWFKTDGTYTNFDLGGITNGTWALVDDNVYVLDKNTVNERYYYILSISNGALINRGPFTKNNQLYRDYLFTAYFKTAL